MSSGHFDSEAQRERRTEHFGLLNLLSNKTRIKTAGKFLHHFCSERFLQDHIPTKQGLRHFLSVSFISSSSTRPYPNKTRIKTDSVWGQWWNSRCYKTISQQNKDEEMSCGHFDSEAQRERRTEHFGLLNLLSNKTRIKTLHFWGLFFRFHTSKRPHPNKTRIKTSKHQNEWPSSYRLKDHIPTKQGLRPNRNSLLCDFHFPKRPHPNKTRIKTLNLWWYE